MLRWAAQGGHYEVVAALLRRGAAVDARNRNGNTALIFASSGGVRPQVVEALLAAGARVNASNKHGNSALAWAALKGHEGVVRTLLARGADPTLTSPNGYTPEQLTSSDAIRAMLRAVGGASPRCMHAGGPLVKCHRVSEVVT
jgi:ankyrin repeat protein